MLKNNLLSWLHVKSASRNPPDKSFEVCELLCCCHQSHTLGKFKLSESSGAPVVWRFGMDGFLWWQLSVIPECQTEWRNCSTLYFEFFPCVLMCHLSLPIVLHHCSFTIFNIFLHQKALNPAIRCASPNFPF